LFIEEVIGGVPEGKRKGRPPHKFYLYDIVNNTRNGLDVDKLDYYRRDMMFSNVKLKDNFDRFIQCGRVLPAEPIDRSILLTVRKHGNNYNHNNNNSSKDDSNDSAKFPFMICYPEKLVHEAIEVFAVRFRMHNMVYTHKSVKAVEFMVNISQLSLNNENIPTVCIYEC
jgi:HD superfamily phosphohydrolase